MKILITEHLTGQYENLGLEVGKVYALPTPKAQPLVNAGYAAYADPSDDVEEHEEFRAVTITAERGVTEGRERYLEGETYWLPESLAFYFLGAGWADVAPKEDKKPRGLAQPKDAREPLSDEERALVDEIIARQHVETVRSVNNGPNEVWKGDPFEFAEGENGRVVDAQTGENLTPDSPKAEEARERATTLDVQDVRTEGGASF